MSPGARPACSEASTATVVITTKDLQNVVVVPTAAIHYSGNATTVNMVTNGSTVSQTVTIGSASGGNTQIVSGLAVGDKVVVPVITIKGFGGTGRPAPRTGSGVGGAGGGRFGGGGGGFTGGGGGRRWLHRWRWRMTETGIVDTPSTTPNRSGSATPGSTRPHAAR